MPALAGRFLVAQCLAATVESLSVAGPAVRLRGSPIDAHLCWGESAPI